MKLTNRTLGVLSILSLVFSCHKPNNDENNAPPAASLRLSRVVQSDDGQSNGTASVIDFVYDDQQRVDKIVFSEGDHVTGTSTTKPNNTCQYYYNGTDKSPYKSTNGAPDNWTSVKYYRYNNTGQLIWDSTQSNTSTDRSFREYTYAPGKILVRRGNYMDFGGAVAGNTVKDSFLIKDNNLTDAYLGSGSIGIPYNGVRCTYDNKINPISNLNIAAWQPIDGVNGFPSILAPGSSKNNIVEYKTGSINFSNMYNENGETNKFIYKYYNNDLPNECMIITQFGTYKAKYYYEAR